MRLIDADKMCADLATVDPQYKTMIDWCIRVTEAQPTVDAVPVIRCKDCKWGKEVCGNIECWADMNLPPECHGYDWYCPNGERKEE